MKKILLSLLILSLFLFTGCSNSNLKEISYDELNKKLENKETFILYFAGNENDLEDKLTNIIQEYDLVGYKIDTTDIETNEKLKLETKITYEDPSIVFIINGIDPTKLSHITDSEITSKEIIQRLKDMNFIKE